MRPRTSLPGSSPALGRSNAPGPPDYSMIRQLHRMARDPIGYAARFWKQYGDITRLHWYGPFAAYLCVHPEMVERVLQANWSNYPKGFFYRRLSVFTGNGLFTSEGDFWLRQRRLSQPAFHRAKIQTFCAVMSQTTAEMLDRWDEHPSDAPFEVGAEMMRLALQIVGRTLFGSDLGGADAERFHALMNLSIGHIDHRFNPTSLPERVPTPRNRRFLAAKERIDHWIMELVRQRHQKSEPHDDLLQLLLDARDPETGEGMSDRQLVDEVLTLMAAGYETTAAALSWSLALLAHNPLQREALEAEARNLNGAPPGFDDLARLPYARMCFEEALRLYPPVWLMSREAKGDDQIAGYDVAARSTVMMPGFLTHRYPDWWPDPERFEPERFTPGEVAKRPKYSYYPFGGGPRLCIGQQYALMEGQIVLSMIASRYRLDFAKGQMPEKQIALVLRPQGGLWMRRARL